VVALERLALGTTDHDDRHREETIQSLVHDHPDIIPMADIEPAYSPMVSICRELETSAGYLDNLWITPQGGLILGECKLVKNPQARREVIAQALDYAQAISGWSYDDLQRQVQKALRNPSATLWALVEDASDLDEAQFIDAVERRLRTSRIMILVIGDGIQEGVEALSTFLQMHSGIHAGLALVDLSIWRGVEGGLLVVPRIPMRTEVIVRGIVTVDDRGVAAVKAPDLAQPLHGKGPVSRTASEAEFYEQLSQRHPDTVAGLKAFIGSLADIGVLPDFRKAVVLRWSASPDATASAGYVDAYGTVYLGDAFTWAARLGHAEAGAKYLDTLAAAINGTVRQYEKSPRNLVGPDGKAASLASLLAVQDVWKRAIATLIAETRPGTPES
jgi:hypothetical protein